MKIKSFTLVWSIILLPLNTFTTFGNEINQDQINHAKSLNSTSLSHFLIDIKEDIETQQDVVIEQTDNVLNDLLIKFKNIHPEALKMALNSYNYLYQNNKIDKPNIITIVDFSKPSTAKRIFVIDIKQKKMLHETLCAHGKNSGDNYAHLFSNNNQSFQSSLGVYIAKETYVGSKGFSLKLDGQEYGINSNARERGVVVHGADYVSQEFINAHGRLGRSQDCPALPLDKNEKIIETIKGGTCFFIYHNNTQYKNESKINKQYDELALNQFLTELY